MLSLNFNLKQIFRKSNNLINYNFNISRGAKRKTERTPVLPAENLINIVKNRSDPVILTDEYYPQWLLDELGHEKKLLNKFYQWEYISLMGKGIPNENQVIDVLRSGSKDRRTRKRLLFNYYSGKRPTKSGSRKNESDSQVMNYENYFTESEEEDGDISDNENDNEEDEEEGKDTKEANETKDGKEGKDGKESKEKK